MDQMTRLLQNPKLARQILSEITNRASGCNLSDPLFPKQDAFINSTARFVAGFCTRRAGKSYGAGLKLYQTAMRFAGTTSVYISLTRDSAKRIMLKDVMKDINRKHQLGAVFNHTELSITLPNGSIIYLLGMDSDKREMDKVLGQKFKLVIIDEAGSFRQDLKEIVYSKLKPACADLKGQIYMIGTPQNFTKGLFYEVVWSKIEAGWDVHQWSAFDNPYMVDTWQTEIEEMTAVNPRVVETPWFKQNYLGQYVVDTNALCYRYRPDVNLVKAQTIGKLDHYVLGIDLGYEDATAFSLLGYNDRGGKLYVVHTSKEKRLNLTQVASRINWYKDRYNPYKMIVDNAAKQAVEEIKQRFKLPLEPADKAGKADFIEIMNNDFVAGNILISDACADLTIEYENLIWDDNSSKKQEHPNCENHLCFVAGTMIKTPIGDKPIESLVVGDCVTTRKGPKRIQYTINREADVLRLHLSNGEQITCTPDHPFWSNGKWIQAQHLTPMDTLLSWIQHKKAREWNLTESDLIDLLKINTLEDYQRMVRQNIYTEKYTHTLSIKFKKIITSITKTATRWTTGLKILSASLLNLITWNMLRIDLKEQNKVITLNCSQRLGRSQRSGIDQRRAEHGIESMVKKHFHSLKRFVVGAIHNISNHIFQKTSMDAALQNALLQKGEHLDLMTLKKNACFVEKFTHETDIQNKIIVVDHVQHLPDMQKVYNITVEDEHEYFANDILVSNCDASLYAYRFCYQYVLGVQKVVKKSDVEKVLAWEDDIFNKKEESTSWWEKV